MFAPERDKTYADECRVGYAELASAVSNAGGLGIVGFGLIYEEYHSRLL